MPGEDHLSLSRVDVRIGREVGRAADLARHALRQRLQSELVANHPTEQVFELLFVPVSISDSQLNVVLDVAQHGRERFVVATQMLRELATECCVARRLRSRRQIGHMREDHGGSLAVNVHARSRAAREASSLRAFLDCYWRMRSCCD